MIVNGATWTSGKTGDGLTLQRRQSVRGRPLQQRHEQRSEFRDRRIHRLGVGEALAGRSVLGCQYPIITIGGQSATQITVYLSNNGSYEWTLGMNIIISSQNTFLTYLCPMPDVSNIFRDDQWHMVTLTRDSNNVGTLYLDGSPLMINLGGGQGRVQSLNMSNTVTNLQNGNNNLWIGTDGSSYFKGSLDDIRVYNRGLSASEVQAMADLPPVTIQADNAQASENGLAGTISVHSSVVLNAR